MSAENPTPPPTNEIKTKDIHWYHQLAFIGCLVAATDAVWLLSNNPDQNPNSVRALSSDSRAMVELQPGAILYTVKPGDTLSKIAADHGINLDVLLNSNSLPDINLIYEGQELIIPPTTPPTRP